MKLDFTSFFHSDSTGGSTFWLSKKVCGVPRVRDMSDVAADEDSKGAQDFMVNSGCRLVNRWLTCFSCCQSWLILMLMVLNRDSQWLMRFVYLGVRLVLNNQQCITGWWFGTSILFSHSVGNNHPNWRTHIFQRGGPTTNQINNAGLGWCLDVNRCGFDSPISLCHWEGASRWHGADLCRESKELTFPTCLSVYYRHVWVKN